MTLSFNQLLRLQILAVLLTALFSATTTFAQEPEIICGYFVFSPEYSTPIENCENPFGRTDDLVTFMVGDQVGVNGQTYLISQQGISDYGFVGENYFNPGPASVFRHEGVDYVAVDTDFAYPERAAIEKAITDFFESTYPSSDSLTIARYTEIYDADYKYPYFYLNSESQYFDAQLNQYVEDVYYELESYVEQNVKSDRSVLLSGTYTAVFVDTDEGPVQSLHDNQNIFQKLWDSLVPKAYAYYYVRTVTFTLTDTPPEPEGASSVLFLPGIQASFLYDDGLLGSEDQVWPPNSLFNNDVRALRMSTDGVSENNIYTSGVLDTTVGVGDVYGGFLEYLNTLQFQGKIENWTPFAYDWRYSVADIVDEGTRYREGLRSAIEEIEFLAADSYSGKVTIIGHSNGGLLAKAIMKELESQEKVGLIDTVILLASPQLGTPKAIGTILHGYDQTDDLGGIIINGQTAREVINNMPGAYGLLPSEKYFEGLNEPLVTFTNGTVTDPYRSVYGSALNNYEQYVRFIRGEDPLERGLSEEKSIPTRANSTMLDEALALHKNELDNWIASSSVKVIEIVGTGLPTMKSIEYREIIESKCVSAGPAGNVCVPEAQLKPYAVLTRYGDGTVVQRSAEGYSGEKKKYFLNLVEVKAALPGSKFTHHNISEIQQTQDLISELLFGTTTLSNQFVSENYTEFNDDYDIEMIDSPVRFLATDLSGNQTGVVVIDGVETIKEDIPGSQYFEFGDTKYFIIPKGTDRTVRLRGEDYGGYTLTTATLEADDTQKIKTQLKNATTTPNLIVEYSNIGEEYSTLQTDIDGDGLVDFETSIEGVMVVEEVVTYSTTIESIKNSNLSKLRKAALIVLLEKAEFYSQKTHSQKLHRKLEDLLLVSTEELIKLYIKKRYLTAETGSQLLSMVEFLKDKQ